MATHNRQILYGILFIVLCGTVNIISSAEVKPQEDLEGAEANGKLEIVKQIKKVNDDGSYTIGYEADDGSFKIESRDVLGNIKGTYGYVDDKGEIKRVSYSTNNTTESQPEVISQQPSVVQRIPKLSKLPQIISSTRRPTIVFPSITTQSTPTSTDINIQNNVRRRLIASTPLPNTEKTKYLESVKISLDDVKSTTSKPVTNIYVSSTPAARLLLQAKPLVRATPASQTQTQKSEGQLIRPEVISSSSSTEVPATRRIILKNYESTPKPVAVDDHSVRANLLRRQLSQEKSPIFDPRQHVLTLQQGSGDDTVDIYSGSVTTGAPRPLFTTTLRPRFQVPSSTPSPSIHRPTIRYPTNYQRPVTVIQRAVTTELAAETTTESAVATESTVPVVQIPATRGNQFVELRHPFHNGAVLVPVHQVHSVISKPVTHENTEGSGYQHIIVPSQNYEQQEQEVPVYVRRVPKFRPIPVQVDHNGYVREVPQNHHIRPVQYPIRLSPVRPEPQKFEFDNTIEHIKPPVSTRDFQKLLEQLIIRQSRLEQISKLMQTQTALQQHQYYQPQRIAPLYPQQHVQFIRRPEINTGPVQFIPQHQDRTIERTQTAQPQQQHPVIIRPQPQQDLYGDDQYTINGVTYAPQSSYRPTKRQPRLLKHNNLDLEDSPSDYLPSDVREMLLLRMLQLAINPALPLEVSDPVASSTTTQESIAKKESVRNVQILGEVDEDGIKRPSRTKRYKLADYDYYE